MRLLLSSPEATAALGARLGRCAVAGTAVALNGDLGAGKTVFARGFAQGLGVPGRVRSPTFVLASRHEGGRHPLVHADLYRVGEVRELAALELHGHLTEGDVVLAEWAERYPGVLPDDHLEVALILGEGDERQVVLSARGPRHLALLACLDG